MNIMIFIQVLSDSSTCTLDLQFPAQFYSQCILFKFVVRTFCPTFYLPNIYILEYAESNNKSLLQHCSIY